VAKADVSRCILRVKFDCLFKHLTRVKVFRTRPPAQVFHAAEDIIVRFEVLRLFLHGPFTFNGIDFNPELSHDGVYDFILDRKNILQITAVAFRLDVKSCCCINELGVNPNFIGNFLNTAFYDVRDLKFLSDLFDIHGLSFVRKNRVVGDHQQFPEYG